MSKNDGGSAFPLPATSYMDGMSLRDWFAGQALASMLDFTESSSYEIVSDAAEEIARSAYLIADAMLAERAKS